MSQWLVSLAILGLLVGPQARSVTDELWEENLDIYREILDHSFLTGLSEGTLSQEAFSFYMIQDAHYLREFARALSITASKAPREEWAALLNRHAVDTLEYEKTLHESVFAEYGDSVKAILEIDNQSSASAGPSEILRMKEHFRHSARYEWMFWESAYQRQAWPPEGN
jgi:thiaminase